MDQLNRHPILDSNDPLSKWSHWLKKFALSVFIIQFIAFVVVFEVVSSVHFFRWLYEYVRHGFG